MKFLSATCPDTSRPKFGSILKPKCIDSAREYYLY